MEKVNKSTIIIALFLLIITLLTLYNINNFTEKEKLCDSGFELINKCHCIPNEGLAKLFDYTDYQEFIVNISNGD